MFQIPKVIFCARAINLLALPHSRIKVFNSLFFFFSDEHQVIRYKTYVNGTSDCGKFTDSFDTDV